MVCAHWVGGAKEARGGLDFFVRIAFKEGSNFVQNIPPMSKNNVNSILFYQLILTIYYSTMIGSDMEASCSGKPDALLLCKISMAGPRYADGKSIISDTNGTNSVVIQSVCAVAYEPAMTAPEGLVIVMGNVASKNQLPRASPVILNSLPTTASGCGKVTRIIFS